MRKRLDFGFFPRLVGLGVQSPLLEGPEVPRSKQVLWAPGQGWQDPGLLEHQQRGSVGTAGPSSFPFPGAGSPRESPVPHASPTTPGDTVGTVSLRPTSSQRPPRALAWSRAGMPRALIRVFPASRGGALASAWLLGVAVPLLALLFGEKNQGFGSSVPSHQGRTPLGGYLPAGRTQAQPGTPRITLGTLCGSCWDRQGVEGPRSEVGAVGAGTDPAPGIGGLWLSPNRASHSVATPRGLCWPREGFTRASGSLARRGQRGVGRGQCPGMLPRCMVGNSLFSLHHLLAPAMAAADPPRGFPLSAWRVHPSPHLSPPSPRSRHPRAPPEPPGRTRTLQTLPWGPSRLPAPSQPFRIHHS